MKVAFVTVCVCLCTVLAELKDEEVPTTILQPLDAQIAERCALNLFPQNSLDQ